MKRSLLSLGQWRVGARPPAATGLPSMPGAAVPLRRPSVEYSLTDHCNLACYGCDHASPLLPPSFADRSSFEADIGRLSEVLSLERLFLIGGEPLMHPEVAEFARAAKASKLAQSVVLVTNGVLLHRAPDVLWDALAQIDVTLYPGVHVRMPIADMVAKAVAHGVKLHVRRSTAFRQTILNHALVDQALVQQVFDACKIAHVYGCHSVYRGRYYKCSVAPYTAKRLRRSPDRDAEWADDGVDLHGNPNLRDELERYLADSRPLPSCRYCLGTSGRLKPHHQLQLSGKKAWQAEDHGDARLLVDPEKLTRVRHEPPRR